ncbi:DNA repair protein RecN [Pseudoflavonifractor phocaeensis]|uniref:DNA repair protein RecN n=1 Tax=Pseudoflavonifractor phocaeensis TaxID=1870988 RepID=UPI0025A37F03|nr:DNA repair protein RecN [Pseudoflavonifractor phocaeensis]MDM8237546.1 DNA repair protein RecN [Pseudoflavonifractor phocaeensis]
MLSLLHIENIALIQSADIRFEPGYNVLTGETGAGKSIVIDSIGAVLGERTSRELIRTGAKSALVTAVFTQVPSLPWLEENGIALHDGEVLLQREIQGDGRNVCRVDGRLVTVAQLRELGRQLLNIHGQHDGQQLLDPASHLGYLDRCGGHTELLENYRTAYQAWNGLRKQIAALEMDEAERSRRVDTLNFQIRELERAQLRAGEDEELDQRRTLLRSAGKLMDALQAAEYALCGDEEGGGVCSLLADAEGELDSVSQFSTPLEELSRQVSELRSAADDAADTLRDLTREMEFSPGELDEVESRLDVLYRLKKKYGATVEEMLQYLDRCRRELDEIQYADDTIARLTKELDKARKEADRAAQALSQQRRKAAEKLEKRVQEELRQLDMPKVRFQVEFAPIDNQWGLDETGMDQVQFLMSANVGEALKPIQKVASGGELARIMLALKNVLAQDDEIGTLVFDEVDTGVSGRAAQKVAEKMAQVARHKQVLCVTHLPQLAAMADTHFSVSKGEREGRTYTNLERLDRKQRREELARLIGGAAVTPALLESAEELLAQADAWREKQK